MLLQQGSKTYDNDFVVLVSKLSNQLHYSNMDNTIAFQSVKLNVDPEHYSNLLNQIEHAITYNLVIKIEYQKNHNTRRNYVFQPYELLVVNQFWYLYGYDQDNRYISLKVNRMNHVEVLEKTFAKESTLPKRKALNEYGYSIDPEYAKIQIKNLDYLSEYIWGKNQKISWISNHEFILEVEFRNAIALKDFALRGGSNIKVMEPKWLIDFLVESYENAMKQYNL
jgi:predicted DNA-binding transcriptional regulator YafY